MCESALHLIGIFPVREHEVREQRMAIHENMSLETVLQMYFESKQIPKERILNTLSKKRWPLKKKFETKNACKAAKAKTNFKKNLTIRIDWNKVAQPARIARIYEIIF